MPHILVASRGCIFGRILARSRDMSLHFNFKQQLVLSLWTRPCDAVFWSSERDATARNRPYHADEYWEGEAFRHVAPRTEKVSELLSRLYAGCGTKDEYIAYICI